MAHGICYWVPVLRGREVAIACAAFVAACAEAELPLSSPTAVAASASSPTTRPVATTARARARAARDTGAESAYTTDVEILERPLAATWRLARIEERGSGVDPTADCRKRLVEHARRLGANALYVEPASPESASCGGSAYQVRRFTPEQREAFLAYTRDLTAWLHARWSPPSTIPDDRRASLCAVYQFNVNARVQIVFVRRQPIHSSGDAAFDESVQRFLEKTMADGTELPRPPTAIAPEEFLTVRIAFTGGSGGRCG